MKHKFLRPITIAPLCAVIAMALNSCSKGSTNDEPTTIIVGTWTHNGDENTLVVNTNGIAYENLTDHPDNSKGESISVSISF